MTGRTKCLLGLVLAAATGAMACSAPPDAAPGLELSADPTAASASKTKHAPASVPLNRADASVLLPPPADADGGAGDGGDGRSTDASNDPAGSYQARCSSYLAADREHESNDTVATANVFGGIVCAGIESANDVDWFVVDTQAGLSFTFEPDDDAEITVKSPSGQTASSAGISFYANHENGRYVVQVRSPGHSTQTYLLVRN